MAESLQFQDNSEPLPKIITIETLRNLNVGEKFLMNGNEYSVEKIEKAAEVGLQFGLRIDRDVPIYYLKGTSPKAQGGYQLQADVVVLFENNTDLTTLEHELIHVVEYKVEPTPGLLALWDKAKQVITEESFDGDFFTFNFMKNIHEFIADGKTKLSAALKKEGLYEEFKRETAYIFNQ